VATRLPSLANLMELFRRSGVSLSSSQYELFWRFDALIRKRNEEFDLTRIRGFEGTVIKHYVDCALIPKLIELPSPLLDIGTGAGFPGIPIKILRPDINLILAEGRARRAVFLEEACGLLELKDVRIYPHKISGRFDLPVEGVITRALEVASETIRRVNPFLKAGGKVILMKGPNCDDEVTEALSGFGEGYELEKDIAYSIKNTPYRRRLLVFRKLARERPQAPSASSSAFSNIKKIESASNDYFKMLMSLHAARGIKKQGLAIVSGQKQVEEILGFFPDRCEGILFKKGRKPDSLLIADKNRAVELSPELFREIDLYGTDRPLALVRVEPMPLWNGEQISKGCTLLVPFQDPANVGAVVRSAAAFGVRCLVILKEAAHPFHPKSLRVSGSTIMRIRLYEGPSIKELPKGHLPHVLLSPGGKDISEFEFPASFCLVPGLEGQGLPEHLRNMELVSVPMADGVESLNAAVATGIALYRWKDASRKNRLSAR